MGIAFENDTRVQIILRKNDLYLVQWVEKGTPRRAWISPDMVVSETGQEAIVSNPGAGIPYGVEWQHLFELRATPADLEKNLRLQGIWTVADLREHPDGVRSALQATYGLDVTALMKTVRNL